MFVNPAERGPSAEVEVSGHIIDSLLLPKILDLITSAGGSFTIEQIDIGLSQHDPSFARIEVRADDQARLDQILGAIGDHGATPVHSEDCRLVEADLAGAFPDGFYSTTNQATQVRVDGKWLDVQSQEMDCGIWVDPADPAARCVPMADVEAGQKFIVGHRGVRIFPAERSNAKQSFEFMNSSVSTEKPKGVAVRQIAQEMWEARRDGQQILIVGGPAIVHTGSIEHFEKLIRDGYVQILFAGNALAAHDIEHALFGTSLGVRLDRGELVQAGHEHHLRAINRIRRAGGIRQAVEQGVLRSGIIYQCIQNGVDVVLAGSIRDDGPLPEVITDVLEAQRAMRQRVPKVGYCLAIATTLHSIAVGNLLPAKVRLVCVDINPSTVIKLSDRGSFQTIGLVTDVEPFLRSLVDELRRLDQPRE